MPEEPVPNGMPEEPVPNGAETEACQRNLSPMAR